MNEILNDRDAVTGQSEYMYLSVCVKQILSSLRKSVRGQLSESSTCTCNHI